MLQASVKEFADDRDKLDKFPVIFKSLTDVVFKINVHQQSSLNENSPKSEKTTPKLDILIFTEIWQGAFVWPPFK